MAMLDASPSFHFAGTFGQEGSTWNVGTEASAAAAVPKSGCPAPATTRAAARTAPPSILRFILSSSSVSIANALLYACVQGTKRGDTDALGQYLDRSISRQLHVVERNP